MARDRRMPSPEEAAALLIAARTAQDRGRHAAIQAALRASLVYWGFDWMIGYALVQFWPGWPPFALWGAVSLGLYALPRWHAAGADRVVSGWEVSFRRAWWVILGGSVACTLIVAPTRTAVSLLLLGAVWGIAYALYGIVADDRSILVLGGVIVALAVAAHLCVPAAAPVVFGLTAGGCQVLLGLFRLRREP